MTALSVHPTLAAIRTALLDAWWLALPVDCSGCGIPGRALCDHCRAELSPNPVRRELPDGTPVVSALRYEGRVREIVLAFKEQGRTDAAAALGAALHAAVAALDHPHRTRVPAADGDGHRLLPRDVELTTVPASARAARRRGYDPVSLILRRAGGRPVRTLRTSTAAVGTQKRLDREARAENRAGTMRATAAVAGRRFVLVDDVLTTGATLTEAVRALRAAGAEVVAAATLAWTPRRANAQRSSAFSESETRGRYENAASR